MLGRMWIPLRVGGVVVAHRDIPVLDLVLKQPVQSANTRERTTCRSSYEVPTSPVPSFIGAATLNAHINGEKDNRIVL